MPEIRRRSKLLLFSRRTNLAHSHASMPFTRFALRLTVVKQISRLLPSDFSILRFRVPIFAKAPTGEHAPSWTRKFACRMNEIEMEWRGDLERGHRSKTEKARGLFEHRPGVWMRRVSLLTRIRHTNRTCEFRSARLTRCRTFVATKEPRHSISISILQAKKRCSTGNILLLL